MGDDPHHGADRIPLEQDVDPEPTDPGDGVGRVELEVVLEALPLLLGENGVEQLADLDAVEHRIFREGPHFPPQPDRRVAAGGQVEVGSAELHDAPQDVVDVERRRAQGAGVALERLGSQGDTQWRMTDFPGAGLTGASIGSNTGTSLSYP